MTRREEYEAYLKSEAWKSIRRLAIKRDGGQCTKCKSKKCLHVHHLKYPEHLGTEPLEYLQTLCEDCHNVLHGGSPRKASKREKQENKRKKRAKNKKLKNDIDLQKRIRKSSIVRILSKEEIIQYSKALRSM